MALENNLGIRAERLSPQVQALILNQTRANYAPTLITNFVKNSSTTPPEDFLTGSGTSLTNAGLRTNGGLQQQLKWGGGRYQLTLDGARNTTSNASSVYNPRLSSNLNASYTQPRCGTSPSTRCASSCSRGRRSRKSWTAAPAAAHQTARGVRSAYYDLVGAIGQLQVAQQSLDLANESLRNTSGGSRSARSPPSTSSKRRRRSRATRKRSSSTRPR